MADSKLGQTIAKLTKYPDDGSVVTAAMDLKKTWQARTQEAKTKKAEEPGAAKADAGDVKPDVKPEVKPEQAAAPAPPPVAPVKEEASSSSMPSTKLERMDSSVQWRPVALTGDGTRDMIRKKLQEAFDKGKADNAKFLREQVTDTAQMAEDTEAHMFGHFGGMSSEKRYVQRGRALMFNLRDPKNPHFIQRVITGQIFLNDLAEMEVKDMASDEMKKNRLDMMEHAKMALMDDRTFKNYTGKKNEDGILKCPRCKSMKTEYFEVQTRSADEPTTKKCNCTNCDYRWKFC